MNRSPDAPPIRGRKRLRALAAEARAGTADAPLSPIGADNPSIRRKQMQIMRDLLTTPPLIDLAREPLTCASTPEEIAERRSELEYRVQWLRALTEMSEAELEMLDRARSTEPDGPHAAGPPTQKPEPASAGDPPDS